MGFLLWGLSLVAFPQARVSLIWNPKTNRNKKPNENNWNPLLKWTRNNKHNKAEQESLRNWAQNNKTQQQLPETIAKTNPEH